MAEGTRTRGAAKKTDPALWDKVKAEIQAGDKGGEPGEWSARKAQMAVAAYKKAGGGYEGRKSKDNHLSQWTREDWGTKSGHESGETGERYLPKAARDALSKEEYARSTAKKRRDSEAGKQFSAQPADVARKTARARKAATKNDGGEDKPKEKPAARSGKARAAKPGTATEKAPRPRRTAAKDRAGRSAPRTAAKHRQGTQE